jgi:hypothetical protein
VGSLPFLSFDEALDYVTEFDIPWFPQLPGRCENDLMIQQMQLFLQRDEIAPAMTVWEKHLEEVADFCERFDQREIIKLQYVGPNTFFTYANPNFISAQAQVHYRKLYKQRICEVVEFVQERFNHQLLFFFDEPVFEKFDGLFFNSVIETIAKSFDRSRLQIGLHCCANLSPKALGQLKELKLQWLGLDYRFYREQDHSHKSQLLLELAQMFQIIFGLDWQNEEVFESDLSLTQALPVPESQKYYSATCGLYDSQMSMASLERHRELLTHKL